MRRLSEQSGFSLVEMLIGMLMMLLVFGAVMTVLTTFQNDNKNDRARNVSQDAARTAMDQMSRDLRSAASLCGTTTSTSCTGTASGVLQRSSSTDIVFQTVEPVSTFGSSDASNQEWVRYCLDSGGNLWRDTLAPAGSAALPAMPSTTICPGDTGSWPAQKQIITGLANASTNTTLFQYTNVPTNSAGQIVQLPKAVQFDLMVPSGTKPSYNIELTGGVDFRNSLASPTSLFTCTKSSGQVTCDASASTDPNGQVLTYNWYLSSVCPPTGSNVSNSETYSAGPISSANIALVVADTAGLSHCSVQSVSF